MTMKMMTMQLTSREKLFKVTEGTEKFLTIAFSSASPNTTRHQWWNKFGAPHTNATTCPNIDRIIKARLSPMAKSQHRQLAKQQALSLDIVGPTSFVLDEAAKGQLDQKSAIEVARMALKLLGNASMHASQEKRKNASQNMNTQMADIWPRMIPSIGQQHHPYSVMAFANEPRNRTRS